MNHVLVQGDVRVAPTLKEIDGQAAVSFDVSVIDDKGKRVAVPVLWMKESIPSWMDEGVAVVVTGRVFRRFFFAGGSTQSLVDISADFVERATPARLEKAKGRVVAALTTTTD